ncbi:FG-GAP repeat domain-containing protein [Streptomyces sp. NPDC058741]|uniref:FG-GAP repeat domain-containing protein n=1 Tax=unclassified Streptomyces TaxID=2593676 RepID=UPI0036C8AD21
MRPVDLDRTGKADLIAGTAHENGYGMVTHLRGTSTGLTTQGAKNITAADVSLQGGTDISSPLPENRYELGWSVATGDFDGDGATDLAAVNIAAPGLNVLKGPRSRTGVAAGLSGIDTQDRTGVSTEQITAGDVAGDGRSDLLVLGQEEITGGHRTRGVLYKGTASGLTAGPEVAGGYAAVIADVDKDGRAELISGARGENGGAGAAWVLRGTSTGITATGARSLGSTTPGGPSGLAYFGDVLSG